MYALTKTSENSPVEKTCGPEEGHSEKRCKIQSGGQEMAVMIGQW